MSRAPSAFRQRDVARAIRAAKNVGLDVTRIEVDPKTEKITLHIKSEGDAVLEVDVPPAALRRRKVKAP